MQTDDDPDRTLPVPAPGSGGRPSSQSSSKTWQAPTAEELQAMLPQYEITALLGRGGMGAVYKGTQINLDRPVAIKILPPGMDDDDGGSNYTDRFKNEARSMAKLSHPGIVAVYDSGQTADGLLYIVMEFIEGTDVQKMVSEQGRLHSAHALAITAHVCDALQYAHERGIVHRDIKPANIMVGYDGVVKVADFGLAKMDRAGESALTRSGVAMGTLHYMAPEALMLGTSVDHRADIYAVGVMLYYMLTGKLPQGMFELPSLQVHGLDPRYDAIIARSLRDDREIRYQSADELRRELDGIITQPVVRVEPGAEKAQPALDTGARPQRGGAPPPRQRVEVRVERRGSPLLWVAVLLLGGWVVWMNFKPAPSALPASTVPASASNTNLSTVPEKSAPPAITPSPVAAAPPVTSNSGPAMSPPAQLQPQLPAPGVWQQLLGGDLRQTLEVQNNKHADLVPEPGGDPKRPRYRAQSSLAVFAKPTFKNCAVRARFGPGWTRNPPYLMVRYQGPGRFISNNIFDTTANLRRVFPTASGQTNYNDFVRKNFSSPVILPQQTYEMEIKVVGDHYTASKDGEVMLEGTDSAYTDGKVGFFIEQGALIESFEYMILPEGGASSAPTPAPAVVTVGPGGWRSLLDEKPEIRTQMQVSDMGNGRHLMQKGFMPVLDAANAAIRLKATGSIVLIAKYAENASGGQHGYRTHVGQGRLFSGWITQVQQIAGALRPVTFTPGGKQPVLAMAAGQEYELELRAYGSYLTVLVNGRIENEFINTALRGQMLAIECSGPAEFTSLEWRPLDAAGNPLPATASPVSPSAEIQKLEQQYRDALAKQVTPAVETYALSIQGSYAAALERAIKAPGTSPAIVTALQEEVQRLASSKTVPDKDASGTPAELISLRDTYRKAVEAFRVQKTAPVKAIYEQQRKVLEKSGGAVPSSSTTPQSTPAPIPTTPFTNSLGMKFVSVPMTGTASPTLMVSIWETREREYEAFVKDTQTAWERPAKVTNGLEPAVRVSWNDAQAFCRWLTDRERRSKAMSALAVYRLPTDHEWSCAVGVGEQEDPAMLPVEKNGLNPSVFPWGSSWPPPAAAGNYQGKEGNLNSTANPQMLASTSYEDGFPILAPVGSFPPNRFGLYDLGGNAWEWCDDWYDASKQTKVGRGSSFDVGARMFLTSSSRISCQPDQGRAGGGFRVVWTPSSATPAPSSTTTPATTANTLPAATTASPPTPGQPFSNSLGMKFVPVPDTQVLVCIHETRRGDYAQFATAVPGRDETWVKLEHQGILVGNTPDHPAAGISLDDARAFCVWLSNKEKRNYRLPTDREWSCAVGIGPEEAKTPNATPEELNLKIGNEYPWGRAYPPPDKSGNLSDRELGRTFAKHVTLNGYNDGFATTAPVMSFKPNQFGIYDLEGNVCEWCSDWYNDQRRLHFFRGGHWLASASNMLLSSVRMKNTGNVHGPIFGFRVVLETAP